MLQDLAFQMQYVGKYLVGGISSRSCSGRKPQSQQSATEMGKTCERAMLMPCARLALLQATPTSNRRRGGCVEGLAVGVSKHTLVLGSSQSTGVCETTRENNPGCGRGGREASKSAVPGPGIDSGIDMVWPFSFIEGQRLDGRALATGGCRLLRGGGGGRSSSQAGRSDTRRRSLHGRPRRRFGWLTRQPCPLGTRAF